MAVLLPSSALQGLMPLMKSYGIDAVALAKAYELPEDALISDDILITAEGFSDFLVAATHLCDDRFLNLKLAKRQGWEILGPVYSEMFYAKTVFDILAILTRYLELHSTATTSYIVEEGDGVALCYEIRWRGQGNITLRQSDVLAIELGLAICCFELQKIVGSKWVPTYAQFRHKSPKKTQILKDIFGSRISFNQDRNAIFLTHEECQTKLPENWLQARSRSLEKNHRASEDQIALSIKVDRTIRKIVSDEACAIESVAKSFDMPVRTLQYRLKQEGISYQTLLDQIRVESALHYLENSDLSIGEIAERLHFSETAVFTRFIKKHTGRTPKQLRPLIR